MKNLDTKIPSKGLIPGVHVWLVLAKAAHVLHTRATRSIAGLGMCTSDFGALELLLHNGPQPVNALGRTLLLTSGSMTAAVDRLERRGLVARRDDPSDRRARIVCLTPAGRSLIRNAFACHAADMEEAAAMLTAAERVTLVGLLKKIGKGEL